MPGQLSSYLGKNVRVATKTSELERQIDKAGAASEILRGLVVRMPNVRDEIDTPSNYVDVVDARGLPVRRVMTGQMATQRPPDSWVLPYFGGGLIAIRIDDCYANSLVTDATWGTWRGSNMTFAQFCSVNGIPCTQFIPWDAPGHAAIDGSNFLTWAQVLDLFLGYGWEIGAHGYYWSHENKDIGDLGELIKEIITPKYLLETKTDASWNTPQHRLGAIIRGFVEPGTWSGDKHWLSWDTANARYPMDRAPARMIMSEYQWSQGYNDSWMHRQSQNYGDRVYVMGAASSAQDSVPDANIDEWLSMLTKDGMRTTILMHDPLRSAGVKAKIKTVMDEIIVLRDLNLLHPVTLSSLYLGTVHPRALDGAGAVLAPPQDWFENFEIWPTTGESSTSFVSYKDTTDGISIPWSIPAAAGDVTGHTWELLAAGGNPSKCLKLRNRGAIKDVSYRVFLEPGQWVFSFDAYTEAVAPTAGNLRLKGRIRAAGGMADDYQIWGSVTQFDVPHAWTRYKQVFTVPDWADGYTAVIFNVQLTTDSILLDNLGFLRV